MYITATEYIMLSRNGLLCDVKQALQCLFPVNRFAGQRFNDGAGYLSIYPLPAFWTVLLLFRIHTARTEEMAAWNAHHRIIEQIHALHACQCALCFSEYHFVLKVQLGLPL